MLFFSIFTSPTRDFASFSTAAPRTTRPTSTTATTGNGYNRLAFNREMTQAESSSSAARNGLKPVTAGAPQDYELPWCVSSPAVPGQVDMGYGVEKMDMADLLG